MTKKIVLVCTSASELKGHPTGVWIEECAVPYYIFKDKGFEVIIASPKGGPIPIDKNSMGGDFFVPMAKQFMHDADAIGDLCHSKALSDVDWNTVDAMYMAGGHGTCVDYVSNSTLKTAIETLYEAGKVVAADCHGPIALAECLKGDGTPLVKDKVVTGFADSEENAVQLQSIVPYLIETRFKELGAKYEKADDWNPKVCVDGNLITGQNPQSSHECAQKTIEALSK